MFKGIESILLFSENAHELADFYEEKVGLKLTNEFMMEGKDEGYEFKMKSGSSLNVLDHSEVKGKNKNPQRMIINFEVDDIEKEVKRIKKNKVKLIQDIYHIEGYGHIATFSDIDGNYFQLVQVRAK
ncbi:hypothetical protein A2954_00570 [Candidatus Roizmanbacteria bacterium RIFCSPLOWO2_01_FULL_37_12]|uniref:VOC domain-containing protein n=1 Tax=Candidatus Roizmanbacteria bacterium RIFCSPLOWO2_01_FULL_37_12 TaxID=1802056 RepID=A0A1F7I9U8_9BACT|nr:MAG: hypothetical protein A3D76_00925 [Candidatus Roizmanbacteria bacterium RIFCSPHIGHO2_02_FULL_37_9b]OGK40119.1 MAG: hypothetical protein A2954_00570 [Candidatus Roizmanbacteria bacterium RIFCSPLOWO2_01_FULL_37_12]